MAATDMIRIQKIGFLGAGNLGQAILKAFLDSGLVDKNNILITGRIEKKVQKVEEEFGVKAVSTNEELIEGSSVVVIGVKPQDFYQAIEPIASTFHDDHVVISLAAGIPLTAIERLIPNAKKILRVMPNTAAKIKQSVIAYSASSGAEPHLKWIEELLATMGLVVPVENDEEMEAMVVAASSGIGFIYELMMYWQEWLEERGFEPETARRVTTQVFKGSAMMSESAFGTPLIELQKKVTSLKGVTAAGLDSMRELEIERALRISFEKAAMRDNELGKSWLKDI
jgi:pyrroline-5-carboxylate reductase